MLDSKYMTSVWSAAPTPYKADGSLDIDAINRLADHHYDMGVGGVFIGGTSGEGPWMPNAMRVELAKATVKANAGRIATTFQITDNSAERMIENLKMLADTGIDAAVIAPPFFALNTTQDFLYDMYAKVIDASPLPIGIYHRKGGAVNVDVETVAKLVALPKVISVKDSSGSVDDAKVLLAARDAIAAEKKIYIYNGNEFDCVTPGTLGCDGMMVGGGCFNARMTKAIFELAKAGKVEEAKALQDRMNNLMFDVFGGKNIACWLAGQKQIMVDLGVFGTNKCIINYQLTPACAEAIKAAMDREREFVY